MLHIEYGIYESIEDIVSLLYFRETNQWRKEWEKRYWIDKKMYEEQIENDYLQIASNETVLHGSSLGSRGFYPD